MNAYLSDAPQPLWAKIDNDVIVPPGWLDQCLEVMTCYDELDLLGIEPPDSRTPAPWAGGRRVPAPEYGGQHPFAGTGYAVCDSIGGIGMFRSRAWEGRPAMRPHSIYGGFTDWQLAKGNGPRYVPPHALEPGIPLRISWITPPLKLFLMDRIVTREPFATLNSEYLRTGQQRPWTNYTDEVVEKLAGWWLADQRKEAETDG